MKHALAALAIAAVLLSAPPARAANPVAVADGIAACKWLKIIVSARMTDLLPADAGLGARHASRALCYLHLTYTPNDPNDVTSPPHGSYSGPVICQIDGNGDWAMSGAPDDLIAKAFPDGNAVGIDNYMTFQNSAGDMIQGFGTHVVHINVDKTGAYLSATFQTLTGELVDNSTFFLTDLPVVGGFTSHGGSVTDDKVPPGVIAVAPACP